MHIEQGNGYIAVRSQPPSQRCERIAASARIHGVNRVWITETEGRLDRALRNGYQRRGHRKGDK